MRSDWFLDILPGQTGFTNGLLVGKERKRGLKDDSKSNGGSHVATPPSQQVSPGVSETRGLVHAHQKSHSEL